MADGREGRWGRRGGLTGEAVDKKQKTLVQHPDDKRTTS